MGTKYIVEVEDKPFELLSEDGFTSEKLFRVKGFNSLVFDWNGLNMLTPYTEPDLEQVGKEAYQQGYERGRKDGKIEGQAEAWVCAKKIAYMYSEERKKIFGENLIQNIHDIYSASEAIEKLKAYEQEKEEQIQIGDEVEAAFGKATVTETKEKHVYYFYADGSYGFDEREHVTKTGRHFPEIAAVLEKMREESNG